MDELNLQQRLRQFLSDPSLRFETVAGKHIQVLSIGEHNRYEGPDFKDSAILIDGNISVGDIEFHKNESDWIAHSHENNPLYRNVILHIVCTLSEIRKTSLETLLISEKSLLESKIESRSSPTPSGMEDLQHFALVRLLRKAAEAKSVIAKEGIEQALLLQLRSFIDRYSSLRRRPVYNSNQLEALPQAIKGSKVWNFITDMKEGNRIDIVNELQRLISQSLAGEGDHLRREMVLNCVLPIAVCVAANQARMDIFVWFWSAKALHTYGVLTKKYPGYSQEFLWQQQGLLEYMRLYGSKKNIVSETIRNYGFAEILDFYKFGSTDFGESQEDSWELEE